LKTEAIVPAEIVFDGDGPPIAPLYGDVYHPSAGAREQAQHVFLAGNDLPARWRGREHFVILETGFGLGNNFLATWQAWRDSHAACAPPQPAAEAAATSGQPPRERLVYVALEKHPPCLADLRRAHAGSPLQALADTLVQTWPPLTPGVHVLDFDAGAVRLLLALGDARRLLPQLQLQADAFFLDGFAPARNPQMWSRELLAALGRKATPGATAATWSVARELREGLRSAGFEVTRVPGWGGKRQMSRARFAPAFVPRRAPARVADPAAAQAVTRRALVIGGGLAGACAAEALVRLGWQCTVLDRHARPAGEASGNPGGLFHGTAHADDGVHARFTRAAALLAAERYRRLLSAGVVRGQCDGLLRLRSSAQGPPWPADYVRALDAADSRAAAGLALDEPAWLYPGGGWIAPAQLCAWLLQAAGIRWVGGTHAQAVRQVGAAWQAQDGQGQVLAEAPVLILAGGATGAPSLPAPLTGCMPELQRIRGQVSWMDLGPQSPPARPLSGHGYALHLGDGQLLFGASTQPGDEDPAVRESDHAFNLDRLQALCGLQRPPGAWLEGRTSWRAVAADRLPVIGALPLPLAAWPAGSRADQCRLAPRVPGVYLLGGLSSRGLTWGPLAAEILAAWINGSPMPLEADLLDAVDPARFAVREFRKRRIAGSSQTPAAKR
jgi:tRNA 5-methylaminomethyl-2-thiouridine biosynthesis bifunctional protein